MKKLISLVIFFIIISIPVGVAGALTVDDIVYNKEKVSYNTETGLWSRYVEPKKKEIVKKNDFATIESEEEEVTVEPTIILTRISKSGKGAHSVFLNENNKPVVFTNSNFEFITDGKLILVDNSNLKYYELLYKDGNFVEVELTEVQLKSIFDNTEIIKVSEFKDNKFYTTKSLFRKKRILLLNDTDRSFYKYSYKPPKVQQTEIKGYIISPKAEKILYSHYGEKEGSLEINIRYR